MYQLKEKPQRVCHKLNIFKLFTLTQKVNFLSINDNCWKFITTDSNAKHHFHLGIAHRSFHTENLMVLSILT